MRVVSVAVAFRDRAVPLMDHEFSHDPCLELRASFSCSKNASRHNRILIILTVIVKKRLIMLVYLTLSLYIHIFFFGSIIGGSATLRLSMVSAESGYSFFSDTVAPTSTFH